MQQAGREMEKDSYSFWARTIRSQGFDVVPEQITAAAEDLTPFPEQFTAYEPGQ